MSAQLGYVERDATGRPVRVVPAGRALSVPETQAQEARDWAQHQAEAKAREAAERHAVDTKLEIEALETYQRLGRAIGGITTQESWVGLAEEAERLVEERELSSRHGAELQARLLRVAKDRRWVQD